MTPETIPGPMPADLRALVEGEYFPPAKAACYAATHYRRREVDLRADLPGYANMVYRARLAEIWDREPKAETLP